MSVCLKVRLASFHGAGKNARGGQLFKLPLDGAGAKARGLNDLPLIKSLIRTAKEQDKDGLPRRSKERASK